MTRLRNVVLREYKESSYAKYNLKRNPFYPLQAVPPEDIQKNLPELLGRDPAIDEIGRYISDLLKGDLGSITILGNAGIGKTHFLLTLFVELKGAIQASADLEKKFNIEILMNVNAFEKFLAGERKPTNKKLIILIDEADQCWNRYPNELKSIYEHPDTLAIGTWKIANWRYAKKHQVPLPKSKCITLDKLSVEVCEEILRKRINAQIISKNGAFPFEGAAIKRLAENCQGNPYTLITDAENALQDAIGSTKEKVDFEIAEAIVLSRNRNLETIQTETKKLELTKSAKRVLLAVYQYTNSFRRKADAKTIAEELGLSRPSIVISFQNLKDADFLEAQRIGKRVLYGLTHKGRVVCETLMDEQ